MPVSTRGIYPGAVPHILQLLSTHIL